MPYIYQIKNKLNGKLYVGKTLKSPEERWREHCKDASKENHKGRPLYAAIQKYGVENFELTTLEEVTNIDSLNDREIYWIEILGSFKNGYNATKGGDGRCYIDYNSIYQLWNDGFNIDEIHSVLGYDSHTIRLALDRKDVASKDRRKRGLAPMLKSVAQMDKETLEIIRVFPSITQACSYFNKQQSGHIAEVCNGKRSIAYGYKWKYI